ncbi:MAG: hypothetical protein HYY12_04475 [Candidatus Methylomirabilis oxyfera]|nr:hypothetical protein [Candidatus Methylomirabilis oxyfera]
MSDGVWRRVAGAGGLAALLLLSGCQFLPAELRKPKLPFRMSPLKHEVTLQPAPGMGPAPFKVDQAQASPAEVKLTFSNPATSAIQVLWAEGTFITADSITYSIGVKGGPGQKGGAVSDPTTIEPKALVQVIVIALTKDGRPVGAAGKPMEPPYRVGLKLTVETSGEKWKGTLWIFVS